MIRFVGGVGHGGRASSTHDVRVQIRHELKEGYSPGFDGGMIREEMPLMEFLGRIFKEGREVENELYRVSKCMAGGYGYNDNELTRVADTYDAMYSNLIRRGKIVLAQHKMRNHASNSMVGGRDPYDLERRQLMANDSDQYRRQQMMQQMSFQAQPGFSGILDGGKSQTQMLREKEKEVAIKEEADRANAEKKRKDDIYYLLT